MRLACISDTHGYLPVDIPQCDILIIAGDITPTVDHSVTFQGLWLNGNFLPWLNKLKQEGVCRYVCFVAGNHDFFFEKYDHTQYGAIFSNRDFPMKGVSGIYYLQDNSVEIEGLKIFGTGSSLPFYDWAFNYPEEKIKATLDKMDKDTDIIISHGPPFGFGDKVKEYSRKNEEQWPGYSYKNVGSKSLRNKIIEVQPKLVVFGHIHENYGVFNVGESLVVNASIVNSQYKMANKPWIIDTSSTPWQTL